MKKLILVIAIVGFIGSAQAQKLTAKDVPVAVKEAFTKAYPMEKDIDWSKDGSNYEAQYDAKQGDISVTYKSDGELVETEMDIPISSLPQGVMDYVKKHHKNHKVKEAAKITSANGTVTYEAEVNGMDLIFDSKGNYLKSVKA